MKANSKHEKKDWVNLGQDRQAMSYDTYTAMHLRTSVCVVESGSQGLDRRWPASPET